MACRAAALALVAAALAAAADALESKTNAGGFRGLPFGHGRPHALRGGPTDSEAEPVAADAALGPGKEAHGWLPVLATWPYYEGRVISLVQRMDLSVLFRNKDHDPAQTLGRLNLLQFVPAGGPIAARTAQIGELSGSHPMAGPDGKILDSNALATSLISTATSLIVWVVFVLAAAFFYRNSKDISDVDMTTAKRSFEGKPFAHGPFDCFEDLDVCCWSFWCGSVIWADSMEAAGVLSFWIGVLIFLTVQFLNILIGVVVWLFAALLFAYFRQDLRKRFGLQNEATDMVKDVAMWCCCWCCAIAQEARHIKTARKLLPSSS